MANQDVQFSITFQDGLGTKQAAQSYLQFPETLTLNDLWLAFNSWYQDVAGITNGHVVAGLIRVIPTITPLGPGDPSSRVEQVGVFNFKAAGSDKRWALNVPCLAPDVLVGDRIDLSQSDVINLVQTMIGSISLGTGVLVTNSHGQTITALADAFVATHRARRQLQRSSFEVA